MADNPTLPALTAQPRMVKCGTREIAVRPLTINDIGSWDSWARAEFLRATLELAESVKDWRDRNEHRTVAMNTASQISLGCVKANGIASSIPGMLQICWLAMRDEKMTREQAWEIISGGVRNKQAFHNLKAVFTEAMIASGLAEEEDRNADPTTLVSRATNLIMG
jgi:hypothetical protein